MAGLKTYQFANDNGTARGNTLGGFDTSDSFVSDSYKDFYDRTNKFYNAPAAPKYVTADDTYQHEDPNSPGSFTTLKYGSLAAERNSALEAEYNKQSTGARKAAVFDMFQVNNPGMSAYRDPTGMSYTDYSQITPQLRSNSQGATGNNFDMYASGMKPEDIKTSTASPTLNPFSGFGGSQAAAPQGANMNVQNFADGGQVGLQQPAQGSSMQMGASASGGQPGLATEGGQQQYIPADMMDAKISALLRDHPEISQHIQQVIQQAMQSADPQEAQQVQQMVHQVVQLATACAQNPALWPQLRAFAIKQGFAGPQDLPEQYEQDLVLIILTAAKAAESKIGNAQQAGIQSPAGPNSGGLLQGPGTGTSDSIPAQNLANGGQVNVSSGEYVIPADVVRAKGKDFFDKMVKNYHQPTGYRGQ